VVTSYIVEWFDQAQIYLYCCFEKHQLLFFFLPLLESYSKIINPKCTSWIHCRAERKPRVSPIFTLKIGVNHLVLTSINWPFQIPIPTLFKCFKKNSSFQKKKSKLKKFALFGFIPVPQYYTLRIRCLLVLTLKSKIPLTTLTFFVAIPSYTS
jgi:hypothetical protein